MPHIHLRGSTSRSELRSIHELLAEGNGSPFVLVLASPLHPQTPGQYSAWVQLVLTWGQDTLDRELILDEDLLSRIESQSALSDVEVLAVFLAERVLVEDRDVTALVAPLIRQVLAKRAVLTEHHGDGENPSLSLLLAAHTFTNKTSPELHAAWEGEPGIEETARSLYHDIWPIPNSGETLRAPLLEQGEVASPSDSPTHITRTIIPSTHPNQTSKGFTSLGSRAPAARGLAHDMAVEVRVQPKPVADEVGEVLFELVQNTEWHASHWPGGRTGASCRVLSFREYSYGRAEIRDSTPFDTNFTAYIQAAMDIAQERSGRSVASVVLGSASIVDSGVGLAKSVALSLDEGHLFGPDTELQYLRDALGKHLRQRRRRLAMGAIGLARVQQSLTNLHGFMSVRTGSVEILRDFIRKPFEPIPQRAGWAPRPLFVDWIPPSEEDLVVGPRVGTAVTMVYPVEFEFDA